MKINIMLDLGVPEETKNYPEPEEKPSVEERVREAIECIESGHDSYMEWKLLNKLYASLQVMKKTERTQSLIEMIEPVLSKYGMCGVAEESN